MNHAAILRGMSTGEADHGRASYYMHTGYREGQGGVDLSQPGLARLDGAGPAGVSAAQLRGTGRRCKHATAPASWARPPAADRRRPVRRARRTSNRPVAGGDFDGRVGLLEEMEQAFAPDAPGRRGRGPPHHAMPAPCS